MLSILATSKIRLTFSFFFFTNTATTEIYTLSLHDALPIYASLYSPLSFLRIRSNGIEANVPAQQSPSQAHARLPRSEEHTSELQSQSNLVCRLLLEKKKKTTQKPIDISISSIVYPKSVDVL